jgi:hypothetical protein
MADKTDPKTQKARLSVVPTGADYAKMQDDQFRYRVNVTSLGGLPLGAKVGAKHLQPGADIDRLIRLGVLTPLDADASIEAIFSPDQPKVPPYAEAAVAHEAQLKADADAKLKSEADEKAKADVIARAKADAEKAHAEAAKAADARAKADADAKLKSEADAKLKAEKAAQDAKDAADAKAKSDAAAQAAKLAEVKADAK